MDSDFEQTPVDKLRWRKLSKIVACLDLVLTICTLVPILLQMAQQFSLVAKIEDKIAVDHSTLSSAEQVWLLYSSKVSDSAEFSGTGLLTVALVVKFLLIFARLWGIVLLLRATTLAVRWDKSETIKRVRFWMRINWIYILFSLAAVILSITRGKDNLATILTHLAFLCIYVFFLFFVGMYVSELTDIATKPQSESERP